MQMAHWCGCRQANFSAAERAEPRVDAHARARANEERVGVADGGRRAADGGVRHRGGEHLASFTRGAGRGERVV